MLLRTAYRALLRLLPGDWDATDRAEMLDHFDERVRCAREQSGLLAAVGVQLGEVLDVARTAARLRWPSTLAESFAQDLRTGLRRTPLVTAMAVASLALGIGATTAVFSALDVWVIRPLPLPGADRLVDVALVDPTRGWDDTGFSPGGFLDWREAARSTELAAWHPFTANLVWDGRAEMAEVVESSANFLDVLGLRPSLGRGFEAAEERAGGAQVALVSDAFWRDVMGADPEVLGRSIILNGEPYTVVGVLPANAHFSWIRGEVWIPLSFADNSLTVVGRVAPDVGLDTARRELQALAERLTEAGPEGSSPDVRIQSFRDALYDDRYEQVSAVLAACVLFVLLIACTNVSNLLLARGISRTHEVAVRASLGARRGRIIRQLLTESFVLAVLGGVVGIGVAWLGVEAMVSLVLSSRHIAGTSEISLDLRVLGFSALATLSSLVLFGLAPALRGSRAALTPRLADGRKTSPFRRRLSDALMVAQIGLALVLLTSTGIVMASLARLHRVDTGFRTEDAIRFGLYVPPASEPDLRKVWQFHQRVLEEVEAIPGAGRATAVFGIPIGPWATLRYARAAGDAGESPLREAEYRAVATNYAEVMGMQMLAGRWFSDEIDVLGSTPTVVVSRVLAEAEWGSVDAAPGQRLDMGGPSDDGEVLVVGVVEAGRLKGPQRPAPPVIFRPMTQRPYRGVFHVVEARQDPGAVLEAVHGVIRAVDPTLALHTARALEADISEQLLPERVILRLLGAMAIVAVLLTLVGVYGVVAHTVGQQRHEMGLRLAMGADRARLIRRVLGQSGRIAFAGLVGGAAMSLLVGQVLVWALEGVESNDPVLLLIVAVLLFTAVLLAAFLPARTVLRMSPAECFRAD